MNTKILSLALFLAAVGNVQSRDVKFSIITFGKKASVQIPALNQTVELKPHIIYNGVQTGFVNGCPDGEFEYTYLIDGKAEPGVNVRKLQANQTTTYNELIGRPETISKLKGMGYPEDQLWTRSYGKTELFDDSYIPTVVIDNSNVPNYFTSPYDFGSSEKIKVPLNAITFILKDTVFTDKNVSTSQKSRYNDKFQFKVKFSDNIKLYKRKSLKFRAAGSEDPSFLGESLYADLAAAIGNPVHDKIFARVYLTDGTPIGLYNIIDVTASKSFLKTEFNGDIKGKENKDQKEVGAIYDCHNADFENGMSCENKKVEKDEKKKAESDYTSADEEKDRKKLAYLVEAMAAVNVNDQNAINEFKQKWLDLDTFFKALSLEYLCGHWDSYWEYSSTEDVPISQLEKRDDEGGDNGGDDHGGDDHEGGGHDDNVVHYEPENPGDQGGDHGGDNSGDNPGNNQGGDNSSNPEPNPVDTPNPVDPNPGNNTPGNNTPGNSTPGNTTPGNTTPGNTNPGAPPDHEPTIDIPPAAAVQEPIGKKNVNKPTNYVLYQDPRQSTESTFKFYFVDQDFDQTFGVGKKVCGPECSYKELIANHQVRAVQLFLKEGTLTRKMFDEHLKSIVQHAYNPVALGRRIDEYIRRYESEIHWDFDEGTYRDRKDRQHKNRNSDHSNKIFTYSDFEKGVEDLRTYIETRAKTVTSDLNFEWDKVPMEPIEKEIIMKDQNKQKDKKSDARMNKAITTSSILAIAIVILLQLVM